MTGTVTNVWSPTTQGDWSRWIANSGPAQVPWSLSCVWHKCCLLKDKRKIYLAQGTEESVHIWAVVSKAVMVGEGYVGRKLLSPWHPGGKRRRSWGQEWPFLLTHSVTSLLQWAPPPTLHSARDHPGDSPTDEHSTSVKVTLPKSLLWVQEILGRYFRSKPGHLGVLRRPCLQIKDNQ